MSRKVEAKAKLKECSDILTKISELLADKEDYETNIKPKLKKLMKCVIVKEIEKGDRR